MRSAATHARFFTPHLKPGMRLLDGGCGPGSITIGLAEIVAPGEAVGIDAEVAQTEQVGLESNQRGLSNLHFREGSLLDIPFADDSFDAVFSHAVLEHLDDPHAAIREMRRVLKPGGVLGLRCGDSGSFMISPVDPLLNEMLALWEKVYWHHGRESRFGRYLLPAVRKAGFDRVAASASYDMWTGTPEYTSAHVETPAAVCEDSWFADQAIELGFANRETLTSMASAWRSLVENPEAFVAEARAEVVAWK